MFFHPVFIFDGPDASGKATQALLLGMCLKKYYGKEITYVSFPVYETLIGRTIGRCLGRWGHDDKISLLGPEDMAVLYALNRLEVLPALRASIGKGEMVILNRGSYSNLYSLARLLLKEEIDWQQLSPDEKAARINSLLVFDAEFYKGIIGAGAEEIVNIFMFLEVKDSMTFAKRRAEKISTASVDAYEASFELQELVREIYLSVAKGEVTGHQAELVLATGGSAREMWTAASIQKAGDEFWSIRATAGDVAEIVFSRLGFPFWQSEQDRYRERIPEFTLELNRLAEAGLKPSFELTTDRAFRYGTAPGLFEKRPELLQGLKKERPNAYRAIEVSVSIDNEGGFARESIRER